MSVDDAATAVIDGDEVAGYCSSEKKVAANPLDIVAVVRMVYDRPVLSGESMGEKKKQTYFVRSGSQNPILSQMDSLAPVFCGHGIFGPKFSGHGEFCIRLLETCSTPLNLHKGRLVVSPLELSENYKVTPRLISI